VDTPYIRVEDTGELIPLRGEVTTVGRGHRVDVRLDDPSVSRLHAEIVWRGPYIYVADLGLSRNGTRVNGRPVARRVLDDGDVLSFGSARCRIEGVPNEELAAEAELRRSTAPELTGRDRRTRLANEVIALGLVRPFAEHGSGQVQHAHGVPEQPFLDGMEPPAH